MRSSKRIGSGRDAGAACVLSSGPASRLLLSGPLSRRSASRWRFLGRLFLFFGNILRIYFCFVPVHQQRVRIVGNQRGGEACRLFLLDPRRLGLPPPLYFHIPPF